MITRPSRDGRRHALSGSALVALALLAGCTDGDSGSEAQIGFVPGAPGVTYVEPADRLSAPDLVGPLLGGGTYDLASERGDDIVVINVWGSWCAPCQAEAPAMQEVYEEVRDQGVQFLGINTRDDEGSASGFVRMHGLTYPSLVDEGGELQLGFADSLPVAAIPTTIVIDRQGRVAARTLSEVTYDSLHDLIDWAEDEAAATDRLG